MSTTAKEVQEVSKPVTLVSSDGFKFVLTRREAYVSETLKTMLTTGFAEAKSGKVQLNMSGTVLEKVCEYLCYNYKHKDDTDVADFDIPPEMALELLVAADFLDGRYIYMLLGAIFGISWLILVTNTLV